MIEYVVIFEDGPHQTGQYVTMAANADEAIANARNFYPFMMLVSVAPKTPEEPAYEGPQFDEELCSGIDNEGMLYYFRDYTNTWKHCGIPEVIENANKLIAAAEAIEAAIGWNAYHNQ